MKNPTKSISLIVIGSVAWLVCAVAMPHQQDSAQAGFVSDIARLAVGTAYADEDKKGDDDDKSKDKSAGDSGATKAGSVCVSIALLTEQQGKDHASEDGKAKDEYSKAEEERSKKDGEDKLKSDEDDKAKAEREYASKAESDGDDKGKAEHESYAKDYEDKSKEYEDKSKEYEDKSKEYEDKSKEYEDRAAVYAEDLARIEAVPSNCKTVDKDTRELVPGVWIRGTADDIAAGLATDGGAGELIDTADDVSDASMESYREIRGE